MKRTIVFEKRMAGTSGGVLLFRLLAILAAVGVTVVFLIFSGHGGAKLGKILHALFVEPFFNKYGIMDSLTRAMPLMIAGIGMSLAFQMKLWNTGGEGQIVMGAIGATLVAMNLPNLPSALLIALMLLAAFVFGLLWAWIAAIPRAYLGVNETITTLMLNYVALIFCQYLVYGPWKDPAASGFPTTAKIAAGAQMGRIPGTSVSWGVLIGLVLAGLYWVALLRSRWGYEIRVIGESQQSARYVGMNVPANILSVLGVSGGLAGLAGFTLLSGTTMKLETGMSAGYGYTAIIIAWLSRLNPAGVVLMSIFMGGLEVGGMTVRMHGLPSAISGMIQGIILFFVLGFDLLTQYRIRLVPVKAETAAHEGGTAV